MRTTKGLLPHKLRLWGWIITIPALLAGILLVAADFDSPSWLEFKILAVLSDDGSDFFGGDWGFFIFQKNNMTDELVGGLLMLGLLLLCFTREKQEDEYIARVRWESVLWAVYAQMIVFIVAIFTIYGEPFWTFMLVNMYLLPLFFVIRYYAKLYLLKRAA